MNIPNLPVEPWTVRYSDDGKPHEFRGGDGVAIFSCFPKGSEQAAVLEFAARARDACDVLMRRGWTVRMLSDGTWAVPDYSRHWYKPFEKRESYGWPDPFTALVAADAWYRENVEAKREEQPA